MANHRKRQPIFSSNFNKTANAAIAGIKRAPDELDTVFGPTATNLTPEQNTAVTAHSVRMDRSVDQQVQNLIANNDGDLNKLSDDFDEQSKALFDTLPDPLKPGAQQQIGQKKQQVFNHVQSQLSSQQINNDNADIQAGMDIYSSNAVSPDASDDDAFENANK